MIKLCKVCGVTKPVVEFHKNRTRPGGLERHCRPCASAIRRKSKYRLQRPVEDYIREQRGLCLVCAKDLPSRSKMVHVDHCHATGRVRGVLCSKCNKLLGMAGDDPDTLDRGARYLRGFL